MAADKMRGFILFLGIVVLFLALLRIAITAYLENEAINNPIQLASPNSLTTTYGPAQTKMFAASLIAAVVTAAVCIMLFVHVGWWNEASRHSCLGVMLIAFALDTLATGYSIKFLARETDGGYDNKRLSYALAAFNLTTTLLELILLPLIGSYHRTQLNLANLATVTTTATPLVQHTTHSRQMQAVEVHQTRVIPPASSAYCPFCANKYDSGDFFCSLCGQSRAMATAAPRRTTVTRTEASMCGMQ